MFRILLSLIILSLVFASFFFVTGIPVNAHTTTFIDITDKGFEPREITIHKGDSVVFRNLGKNDHWPASNIHPTHTVYPDSDNAKCGTDGASIMFDACEVIKPGGSYSFVFEYEGVWRFHDHRYSQFSGTVVVEGSEGENAQEPKSFWKRIVEFVKNIGRGLIALFTFKDASHDARSEPRFSGYFDETMRISSVLSDREVLGAALQRIGTARAMDKLVEESEGGSSFDCHQQAHDIGRLAYEIYQERAFQDCSAACHSGCYHGAMEKLLSTEGTNNISARVNAICSNFRTAFGKFECLHGVGHGIMAYANYDLPQAIEECGRLSDSFAQSSCYGGVFMENILTGQGLGALGSEHETIWVNQTDLYYPCNAIDQSPGVQFQCYQMQTSWMLRIVGHDFDRLVDACLYAPTDMIHVCFKSFGRDVAGQTLRNPLRISELCSKVPQEKGYYEECVVGAVNVIVDFWGPALQGHASDLCRILEEGKSTCYQTLANRLPQLFSRDKQEAVCRTFEERFKHLCLEI